MKTLVFVLNTIQKCSNAKCPSSVVRNYQKVCYNTFFLEIGSLYRNGICACMRLSIDMGICSNEHISRKNFGHEYCHSHSTDKWYRSIRVKCYYHVHAKVPVK